VDEAHDGSAFETEEREKLCDYVDQSLTEHGVDIVALTAPWTAPVPAHGQVVEVVGPDHKARGQAEPENPHGVSGPDPQTS
jgi:hypothetical protein